MISHQSVQNMLVTSYTNVSPGELLAVQSAVLLLYYVCVYLANSLKVKSWITILLRKTVPMRLALVGLMAGWLAGAGAGTGTGTGTGMYLV